MTTLNLVVNCANRKRYPTPPGLAARDLCSSDLAERLRVWTERLESVSSRQHAAEGMYCGDHWSVARSIPSIAVQNGLDVRLWICSAGYGLIRSNSIVKPYQATFNSESEDCVTSGAKDRKAAVRYWWQGVCTVPLESLRGIPRTLSELTSAHPRTPLIIAASLDYLDAMSDDITQLLSRPFFKDHLSIVCCGANGREVAWSHNLLPCDGTMLSAMGGTLTSLNTRITRHIVSSLQGSAATFDQLAKVVRGIPRAPLALSERKSRSDQQIIAFIRQAMRRTYPASRSRLLRDYRDAGFACEQSRFAELYRVATRMEVS